MPFITEELWQALTGLTGSVDRQRTSSIMKASWPESDEKVKNTGAIKDMQVIQEIVTSVRTVRSEMGVPPGKVIDALIKVGSLRVKELLDCPY